MGGDFTNNLWIHIKHLLLFHLEENVSSNSTDESYKTKKLVFKHNSPPNPPGQEISRDTYDKYKVHELPKNWSSINPPYRASVLYAYLISNKKEQIQILWEKICSPLVHNSSFVGQRKYSYGK